MTSFTKTLAVAIPILLLFLTAVAGYAFSQIQTISLPISQTFAFLGVLLPLVTGISTQAAYTIFRRYTANPRRMLYLLAIYALQLIYETIIATMSINYMVPNCQLEARWLLMYRNKDEQAIRRIQDRFDCCGFNSVRDRAWPFPHGRPQDGFGADQCVRRYGRERSCVVPWTQAEQTNAGLFLMVAITIFIFKAIILLLQFTNIFASSRNLTSSFNRLLVTDTGTNGSNHDANARILGNRDDSADSQEQYRDEVDDGQDTAARNENGNSARVQPSGLANGSGGQQWRDSI